MALGVLLSGCTEGQVGFDPSAFFTSRAPARISVTEAKVAVMGPEGYCIDPSATEDAGSNAFVLLGSCASITNSARAARPGAPALLTASVAKAPEGAPSIADSLSGLPEFFRSEAGRAALSRTGDAEAVEILETASEQGMFLIRARDRGENPYAAVEESYWRAIFDVDGAIVTITVLSFADSPLDTATARSTLMGFAEQIRAANPATRPAPAARPRDTRFAGWPGIYAG